MSDSKKQTVRRKLIQQTFNDEQFIWRFSPNQTDPRLLQAISVGRDDLLQNVLEKVSESATTAAKHHVLLFGPSGIGKTHFVSLLQHRLASDNQLNERIQIAWLNENETTTSIPQLLVRIYQALCDAYPAVYSPDWLDEVLDRSPAEIEEILTRRLITRFKTQTLVILVENFNLLMEHLGSDGQRELRSLLQENSFACLVATSRQLFKEVADRDQPFFGFFQPIQLNQLTVEQSSQLLVNIARSTQQKDVVAYLQSQDGRSLTRAIYHLAAGNHRIYVVLSGCMTCKSFDQLVLPFQKMADDLTPYYQERLRSISPQQRQIVELLCREQGTLTPKETARRLLATENTIGSQVRKLAEIGYLTGTRRGRETFYELTEPLMRLAYQVKQQQSVLVTWIDFLRTWYRPEETKAVSNSNAQTVSEAIQPYNDSMPSSLIHGQDQAEMPKVMFDSIFGLNETSEEIQQKVSKLVDTYQAAHHRWSNERGKLDGTSQLDPLVWLADGLVKSLGMINPDRFSAAALESYAAVVEAQTKQIRQFEIPLRLFRYGIRYLVSKDPSEFVELIKPEREILHQAFQLDIAVQGTT